jgi:hypothetical protein
MPKTFKEILDENFSTARVKGVFESETNEAEASKLGLSPAVLSRLKNNKAFLTDARVKDIAERLTKILGEDKGYQERLEEDLLLSREDAKPNIISTISGASRLIRSVKDLFDHISNHDSLLCVDYRDFPQTTAGGEYPRLADDAAKAIAHGLDFAMFQPFGPFKELEAAFKKSTETEKWKRSGRGYILRLAEYVREAYTNIKKRVDAKTERNTEKGDIILYESTRILDVPACGINSRLFYVNSMKETGFQDQQIYQWVNGRDDDDYFVRRDINTLSQDAVSETFFPVTNYWLKHKKLPVDDGELEKAVNEVQEHFALSPKGHSKRKKGEDDNIPWTVYKEPKNAT